jgi:hypothetical protein
VTVTATARIYAREAPPMTDTTTTERRGDEIDRMNRALAEIAGSSSVDFESTLVWGQWCRDVALEAMCAARTVQPKGARASAGDKE